MFVNCFSLFDPLCQHFVQCEVHRVLKHYLEKRIGLSNLSKMSRVHYSADTDDFAPPDDCCKTLQHRILVVIPLVPPSCLYLQPFSISVGLRDLGHVYRWHLPFHSATVPFLCNGAPLRNPPYITAKRCVIVFA